MQHPDPTTRLRDHGLRITPQRLAVLEAVAEQPHCTADAVADAVRTRIGSISLQSVYDTLGTLTEKQLIRRVQPAGSPALYDPRVGDNHHHVICRSCHATHDVDCAIGAAPCLEPSATPFVVDEAEVIFWGTCPACVERARGNEAPTNS
jgi:Fur family transcriptional regulator, stress-responsive regulator